MTWEKLGLNDRRGQRVQLLGHEAEKCDCVSSFCWFAFLEYILISGSVHCSVSIQMTLSVILLNMNCFFPYFLMLVVL